MRAFRGVVLWFHAIVAIVAFAVPSVASELPRSIVVLEQSDVRGPFYAAIFSGLRATVNESATTPVTIYVEHLDLSRFQGDAYEQSLRNHFRTKYSGRPIGVIVAVGSMTLDYAIRWRDELWPGVTIVFAFVDETSLPASDLLEGVTGRITRLRLADMVAAAEAMVPGLKRVAIVGDDLDMQPVFGHFREEIQALPPHLEVIDLTGLPMTELRKQVASLPDDSVILYTAIYSDGAGTFFPPADAVAMIAEVANRPIVAPAESYVGRGPVGGYVAVPSIIGSEAGELALRILDGESPSSIPIEVGGSLRPIFDWRQLQRWGVDERQLPPGSEVRDRTPGLLEEYGWEITAITVVLILQTGLIIGLLYEHGRRRTAEVEARQRIAQLAHLNRRATVGELSSTIAHELNQPLGAIRNNATTGERILSAANPNLENVRQVLSDIKRDNARASEVIDRVRRLVKKDPTETVDVDIGETLREVFEFVGPQASAAGVTLELAPTVGTLIVRGDPVQLQQVVLNLVLNAIDSISSSGSGKRRISGTSRRSGASLVEVEIADTGPGVPNEWVASIFEPFVSTKNDGMGMGLSVARSIIEAHGGRIWVQNDGEGGAVFRFALPLATTGSS